MRGGFRAASRLSRPLFQAAPYSVQKVCSPVNTVKVGGMVVSGVEVGASVLAATEVDGVTPVVMSLSELVLNLQQVRMSKKSLFPQPPTPRDKVDKKQNIFFTFCPLFFAFLTTTPTPHFFYSCVARHNKTKPS